MQNEELELIRIDSKKKPQKTIMECIIKPSDTLLSISIKYNVPIAELKRVNNILKDQEFYALRKMKIPVQPFSLLLPEDHQEERTKDGWMVESRESKALARWREAICPSSHLEDVVVEQQHLLPEDRMVREKTWGSNHVMLRVYAACMVIGFIAFLIIMNLKK